METVSDFLSHPRLEELRSAVRAGIGRANDRSEHRAGRVQKFTILPKEASFNHSRSTASFPPQKKNIVPCRKTKIFQIFLLI